MIDRSAAPWAPLVLALGLLAGCGGEYVAQAPAGTPAPTESAAPRAAEGFRLVGYGDLAVEVPSGWGTNEIRCSTPTKDTVLIDLGGVRACGAPQPKNVESVSVSMASKDYVFEGGEETTVAGRPALRTPTACEKDNFGGAETCRATVHFPAAGVVFRAESSTSAERVDAILGRIRAVPGSVGVPGFRDDSWSSDDEEHGPYLDELRAAGLVPEVTYERRPGLTAGYVLAADPKPGTVVRPGDTVEVTVVPEPRGLGDTVPALTLEVSSPDEDLPRSLSHEQIASGETLEVPVGTTLRIYGKGHEIVYGADLDGTSVVPTGGLHDDRVAHFRAARPGTTRMTVTVANKTERDEIGTVTVVVK